MYLIIKIISEITHSQKSFWEPKTFFPRNSAHLIQLNTVGYKTVPFYSLMAVRGGLLFAQVSLGGHFALFSILNITKNSYHGTGILCNTFHYKLFFYSFIIKYSSLLLLHSIYFLPFSVTEFPCCYSKGLLNALYQNLCPFP